MVKMVHGKEYVSDFDVLVDSDAFVGFFLPDDALHEQCRAIFEELSERRARLVTTNYVIAETATMISRRSGQPLACNFVEYIYSATLPVVYITEALHRKTMELFLDQSNKNTSFFDCANVAIIRHLGIPKIFSFDQIYPKKFDLSLMS